MADAPRRREATSPRPAGLRRPVHPDPPARLDAHARTSPGREAFITQGDLVERSGVGADAFREAHLAGASNTSGSAALDDGRPRSLRAADLRRDGCRPARAALGSSRWHRGWRGQTNRCQRRDHASSIHSAYQSTVDMPPTAVSVTCAYLRYVGTFPAPTNRSPNGPISL